MQPNKYLNIFLVFADCSVNRPGCRGGRWGSGRDGPRFAQSTVPPGSHQPPCGRAVCPYTPPAENPAVEVGTSPAAAPCSASSCDNPYPRPPHQPGGGGSSPEDFDGGRSWDLILGMGALMFLLLVQFSFTSHLVLQACKQRANELAGLSMELRHLQHWSEGASSEELLLWMRSQHRGKVLGPSEYLHQLLPIYMCFYG